MKKLKMKFYEERGQATQRYGHSLTVDIGKIKADIKRGKENELFDDWLPDGDTKLTIAKNGGRIKVKVDVYDNDTDKYKSNSYNYDDKTFMQLTQDELDKKITSLVNKAI